MEVQDWLRCPGLPPQWLSVQVMVANKDGYISPREETHPILHFCCQKCLNEYSASQELRERMLLADQEVEMDLGDE